MTTPEGSPGAGASSGLAGSANSAGNAGGGSSGASGAGSTAAGSGAAGSTAAGSGGAGSTAAGSAGAGSTAAGSGGAGSTAAGTGAPESKPVGYGQEATGGGSAKVMPVANMAAMQAAVDGYSGSGGLVLQYTGSFDFTSIKDPCVQHTLPAQTVEIKNKSDITIEGKDGSSANFGIHVAGDSHNIIIRNMTIGLNPGGDASDLISIEGMSSGFPSKLWIDHNELFTSMAVCAGAGDTAFDGMIDVKKGADLITVSYNYMHDHHKMSLNGYTDTDDAVRHITFHHNLFENIGSRAPLQRHGYSHMLNNYFSKISASGVNIRMGGYSLVEANYFETVNNPVTARDSTAVGFWDLRSNNLATAADVAPGNHFGITWDAGNAGTVNATAWTTTAAYPVALGYSYKADPFQCIHDGLRAAVGAGKALATLKCK
ncbi:MAG: polysaccharide lyase family 1 protein [Polyangiaceae bacterium]